MLQESDGSSQTKAKKIPLRPDISHSIENAVINAMRNCYKPVKSVLRNEAAKGDATALGLNIQLKKLGFIAKKQASFKVANGDKQVTEIAAIGAILGAHLESLGFENAYCLIGKYLTLKKNNHNFEDWLLEELQNDIYYEGYAWE
uniref:Uncharacterized protein n=1 Tax=Amphimedon queenslandica TaxID=400682 RepID=A0A1X7UJB0_AMPQE